MLHHKRSLPSQTHCISCHISRIRSETLAHDRPSQSALGMPLSGRAITLSQQQLSSARHAHSRVHRSAGLALQDGSRLHQRDRPPHRDCSRARNDTGICLAKDDLSPAGAVLETPKPSEREPRTPPSRPELASGADAEHASALPASACACVGLCLCVAI